MTLHDVADRVGPDWFWNDFDEGQRIASQLQALAGVSLKNATVAHVGSGDGSSTLGLFQADPARLVAFDEDTTNRDALIELASRARLAVPQAERLAFNPIHNGGLPTETGVFDVVVVTILPRSSRPVQLLGEVRRLLRPNGVVLVDARPLYNSAWGAQLPADALGPFDHLTLGPDEIARRVRANVANAEHADALLDRFSRLNRITVDQVQQIVASGGLHIDKVSLASDPTPIPAVLQHRALTELCLSGIALTAYPLP